MTAAMNPASRRLVDFASRPCGVNGSEADYLFNLMGEAPPSGGGCTALGRLWDRGHICRVLDAGRFRYFATEQQRDAWGKLPVRRKLQPESKRILELAARLPYGVVSEDVAEMAGCSTSVACAKLADLRKSGYLFRAKRKSSSSSCEVTHHFATEAAAQAWRGRPPLPPKQLPSARVDGGVEIPLGVKFTRGPSQTFDPRFQVDPESRPYGLGMGEEWRRLRGGSA